MAKKRGPGARPPPAPSVVPLVRRRASIPADEDRPPKRSRDDKRAPTRGGPGQAVSARNAQQARKAQHATGAHLEHKHTALRGYGDAFVAEGSSEEEDEAGEDATGSDFTVDSDEHGDEGLRGGDSAGVLDEDWEEDIEQARQEQGLHAAADAEREEGEEEEGDEGEEMDDDIGDEAGGAEEDGRVAMRRQSDGASSSDTDEDDSEDGGDEGPSTAGRTGASFLAGDKGISFAKAFDKIMSKRLPAKAGREPAGGDSSAAAAEGGTVPAGKAAVPILSASASLAKRKDADKAHSEARRKAKQLRLEMKRRGHLVVPRRGEDPAADARDKALSRLATRGVVLLFNAVNKAQKARQAALLSGAKGAPKLSRASLLAELKAGAKPAQRPLAASALAAGATPPGESNEAAHGAGWDVLGQGFPGVVGGSKMKDWDRQGDSDDDVPEHLQDDDGGSSEGDGW